MLRGGVDIMALKFLLRSLCIDPFQTQYRYSRQAQGEGKIIK